MEWEEKTNMTDIDHINEFIHSIWRFGFGKDLPKTESFEPIIAKLQEVLILLEKYKEEIRDEYQ